MPQPMIELHDTPLTAIAKVSNGNVGAVQVLVQLFQTGAAIDPDSAFGAMGPIFSFESLEIYGPNIWVLYKDCCGSDILGVQTVLRAAQLGILPRYELLEAIRTSSLLDTASLLTAVQAELPAFGQVRSQAASNIEQY